MFIEMFPQLFSDPAVSLSLSLTHTHTHRQTDRQTQRETVIAIAYPPSGDNSKAASLAIYIL